MVFNFRLSTLNLRLSTLTTLIAILTGFVGVASAQYHEDFESATPSWERRESDCVINESKWIQRRSNEVQTKNRFEKIFVEHGAGKQILISHEVPPAFVISELMPAVRIKASRPGIQFFVRVVLPHTDSPTGDGPLTTLLPGPRYRHAEKWESLSFQSNQENLEQQLRQEVWLLRQKYGPQVDQRDAYIDKVVLDIYTGAGALNLQIDDLTLGGIVSADRVAKTVDRFGTIKQDQRVQPATLAQDLEKQKSLVLRDGTVLLVKKTPFFPRIIQHNGEPFDYLKAIGFNTIELKTTATNEQLRMAHELDLWLVCPAPSTVGLSPIGFQFDRVMAWTLGDRLTGRDLPLIQQRIREIRESDQRVGRPTVASADSNWSQLAKLTDIVAAGVEPIGTSFLASQYSDWIQRRSQSIGNGKPIWADVQTQLSQSLKSQIDTLATQSPPIPIEPQQIQFLAMEAIAGGARGLRFVSRTRLDAPDPVTRLRAQTIEWINAKLTQIEPWVAGGALIGEIQTGSDQVVVTAIKTNRSRLLLIQRPTHHEQYVAGDVPMTAVAFQDSAANSTDTAYLIGEAGLVSLSNLRSHTGTQIQIENCPFATAVVLTQDPLVVNKLTQTYERFGKQSILQMHTELSQHWLAIMQLIENQMVRMGRESPASSSALDEAVNSFQTAQSLINGASPQTAVDYIHRTDERLAMMRREMITGPLGMFQSKTSTPFVVHCSLIPLHWELASRLVANQWNPNALAGGDFENLPHMTAQGWQNRRLDDDMFATKVELSELATVGGRFGLRMSVFPKNASTPAIESTPLWIATPEIPVKVGQLVRVHGWVNVPQTIQGSVDGLTITESLGGPEMAERIPVTNGWQEFTLYRGAPSNGMMSVTFSLNGIGEAMIDEVTIKSIDLPVPTPRQARK